jgi:hypothetical protein
MIAIPAAEKKRPELPVKKILKIWVFKFFLIPKKILKWIGKKYSV